MKKEYIISITCAALLLLTVGATAVIITAKKRKHCNTEDPDCVDDCVEDESLVVE